MRKLAIIPVVLIALVGIVFASGILYPDTPGLPRFPGGAGTMSGILSLFEPDGTAPNTMTLSGVSATGYLQNTDCSIQPVNKVWVGVDENGKGNCGNVVGLVAIGNLSEFSGDVIVWRDGTSGPLPAVLGQELYEGDIISSSGAGIGVIRFAADSSLIRFSTGTDLELRYGTLGGQTVAEVILNDGRLWGRILSSTGVNLGGGGMVTGVRGTSVDLQGSKVTGLYTVNILSSTSTENVIQKLALSGGGDIPPFVNVRDGITGHTASPQFGSGTLITYMSGATEATRVAQSPEISYTNDPWIRNNTIVDVVYMSDTLSGSTNATLVDQLNRELDTTIIAGNTGITQALLTASNVSPSEMVIAAKLLDEENQPELPPNATQAAREDEIKQINEEKSLRLKCKRDKKTYFPDLDTDGTDGCDGTVKTLAVVDFDDDDDDERHINGKKIKYKFSKITNPLGIVDPNNTNIIDSQGKYLSFNGGMLNLLKGKTIEIKFDGSILNPLSGYFKDIIDLGDFRVRLFSDGKWRCSMNGTFTSNSPECTNTQIDFSRSNSLYIYKIFIPSNLNISKFVLGNGGNSFYAPIMRTIKSIKIY